MTADVGAGGDEKVETVEKDGDLAPPVADDVVSTTYVKGLPDWDPVPPQRVLRRRKKAT